MYDIQLALFIIALDFFLDDLLQKMHWKCQIEHKNIMIYMLLPLQEEKQKVSWYYDTKCLNYFNQLNYIGE